MKVVATILIGLFLTFCGHESTTLHQVKAAKTLRVLTRNGPTTFYEGPYGPTGFEYDLARRFADSLGVSLELVIAPNASEVMSRIHRGEAHLAAAGLKVTPRRKSVVRFGPIYQDVREQVVYHTGTRRPRSPKDLAGRALEVVAGSVHAATLARLREQYPEIAWRENPQADSGQLIELVWQQSLDLTVADSNEIALVRRFYPELGVGFDLEPPRMLAWAFPPHSDDSLYIAAVRFFNRIRRNGELAQLIERHYGHVNTFDYVATRKLITHVRERLPGLLDAFRRTGERHGLDWRLLAAIGYQESHWKEDAVSPTGVRGIMMLTQSTAEMVGVRDRRDPAQSIDGGARYFIRVKNKIPDRVREPDRTWLALAAYNIGFGHLEDARVLAQRNGADPDRWVDVKKHLPLLAQEKWYKTVRHGYARGYEPVRYVENVRRYFDLLLWLDTGRGPVPADGATAWDAGIPRL